MGKLDKRRPLVMEHCDGWKYRIVSKKGKGKEPVEYCEHEFSIGDNRYSFVERKVNDRIIVNPDYTVKEGLPTVGGIPKQYGELIFWDYFFQGKGWERVRPITNNERICLELIREFGYFSGWENQNGIIQKETVSKADRRGFLSFLKKKAGSKAEQTTDAEKQKENGS